jgi:hypothetical protein
MGYTHYWTPKPINFDEWCKVVDDMRRMFAAVDTLSVEYDLPNIPPLANSEWIYFNGKGDAGHETFMIERESVDWTCCKTAQKPYDIAVTAALIYLSALHGFDVESDGDSADWQAGLILAKTVWPELSSVLVVPNL